MIDSGRMDKWLWAVRAYKTRILAADACRLGRVTVAGLPVKASRMVKVGDVIVLQLEEWRRTLQVLQPCPQRIGAALVPTYAADLTLPEDKPKKNEPRLTPLFFRPKGAGRPTKKERRSLNDILESS